MSCQIQSQMASRFFSASFSRFLREIRWVPWFSYDVSHFSGHLRWHDASFSLWNRRICFKISQVLKLFSAISFHLQGWQSLTCLACILSPPFFCWTTDQPPQKSRTCAAATIFWSWSHKGLKWQALATSDCVKRESCWRDSSFGSQCQIRWFKHQSLTYIIYVCIYIYKYITYYKKKTANSIEGIEEYKEVIGQ